MSKIEDINDHMAWVCDCGCASFNLLKSGNIECSDCERIQQGEHDLNKASKEDAGK